MMSSKETHVVLIMPSLLRLHDNPCLHYSLSCNANVIPVYVNDDSLLKRLSNGMRALIDTCVEDLSRSLSEQGAMLTVLNGETSSTIKSYLDDLNKNRTSKASLIYPLTAIYPFNVLEKIKHLKVDFPIFPIKDGLLSSPVILDKLSSSKLSYYSFESSYNTLSWSFETDSLALDLKGNFAKEAQLSGASPSAPFNRNNCELFGESLALRLVNEYLELGDVTFSHKYSGEYVHAVVKEGSTEYALSIARLASPGLQPSRPLPSFLSDISTLLALDGDKKTTKASDTSEPTNYFEGEVCAHFSFTISVYSS